MHLINTTKNQHYLPQVEQRMNAANPDAPPNRQRIYSFKLLDREQLTLKLEHPNGRLISENSAIRDLFSFDVAADKKLRMNFEALFGEHEAKINTTTRRILARLEKDGAAWENKATYIRDPELRSDFMGLFTMKILNFARNPYSIPKVLNTFGALANYTPTSPQKLAYFDRILNGRRPHQQWLCKELGITDQDYVSWLKMLFMLFVEYDLDGNTILYGTVKGMFEARQHMMAVMVCTYSEPVCLVSDRAFSTNIQKDGVDGFDFNVTSHAFVRYVFGHVGALAPDAPLDLVNNYRRPPQELLFHYRKDDMAVLGSFNRNVIYQSAQRVYSAIKTPLVPPVP
jgi:hypothetical protein